MNLWIRVEADIADSVKVRKFAQLLRGDSGGVPVECAVGLLVFLWGKVADKRETGDIGDVPDDLLEEWARWRGERGHFAKCFRETFASDGHINDWRDHQGKLIERRAADRARWQRRNSAGDSGGASAVPPLANGNGNGKEERRHSAERRVRRLSLSEDEQSVIDHYRSVHPLRLRGDIPDKTIRLLRNALSGYSAPDLCRAIDGNAGSQFHRDGNHMGLNLILRDSEKIDYFMGLVPDTIEMTDDFGRMVKHKRNESGEWVAVA